MEPTGIKTYITGRMISQSVNLLLVLLLKVALPVVVCSLKLVGRDPNGPSTRKERRLRSQESESGYGQGDVGAIIDAGTQGQPSFEQLQ